jgi:CheY-like chemotaxis protein
MRSAVDRGSLFAVTVPVGRGVAVSAGAGELSSPPPGLLAGLHVLAVDNEPAIVEGLSALLKGWGITVFPALNAAEAVSRGLTHGATIDVILADYHIHREDGIELVQALRRAAGTEIPAVLITADRTPHVRTMAEAAHIHYLRKPVKPAALRAVLSQLALSREAAE